MIFSLDAAVKLILAVVFAGIVTSSVKTPSFRVQLDVISPRMLL